MPRHTVCHVEFHSTDLDKSQAFYASVFDWQFRKFGDDMVVFGVGDAHVGGLIKAPAKDPAHYAVAWFDVEDVDATLTAVELAGGSVNSGKKAVPGVGWSATFADVDGNPVGIVQFDRA